MCFILPVLHTCVLYFIYLLDGSYYSDDYGNTWYQTFENNFNNFNFTWQGVSSDMHMNYVYTTTLGEGIKKSILFIYKCTFIYYFYLFYFINAVCFYYGQFTLNHLLFTNNVTGI
jgi:hypothetical protein